MISGYCDDLKELLTDFSTPLFRVVYTRKDQTGRFPSKADIYTFCSRYIKEMIDHPEKSTLFDRAYLACNAEGMGNPEELFRSL